MTWQSAKDNPPPFIEIDERPEFVNNYSDWVLVTSGENKNTYIARYNYFHSFKYGNTVCAWEHNETGCGCCSDFRDPTHWMFIPELPK